MSGRRVLIVQSTAERYGSDRAALGLATGLARRGWEVEVAVPGDGPLVTDMAGAGIPVRRLDPGAVRRVVGVRGLARAVLRLPIVAVRAAQVCRRFDVVHLNTSVMPGAAIGARVAGRPPVVHLRESYAGRARVWAVWARVLRRLAGGVVAVSEAVADEARRVGLGPLVSVVHDAPPLPGGVATGGGGVVCVGRLNDWKGQDVLVEALHLLARSGRRPAAVLVGDVYPGGEHHRRRLEALIEERGLAGQVTLTGQVDDPTAWVARADVAVFPSLRPEPFGFALVEAMAMGVACVATAAGGPLEIVDDGRTGRLVPPDDVPALAGVLAELLADADQRRRLGAAARVAVRGRFTADAMIDGVEAAYARLGVPAARVRGGAPAAGGTTR